MTLGALYEVCARWVQLSGTMGSSPPQARTRRNVRRGIERGDTPHAQPGGERWLVLAKIHSAGYVTRCETARPFRRLE